MREKRNWITKRIRLFPNKFSFRNFRGNLVFFLFVEKKKTFFSRLTRKIYLPTPLDSPIFFLLLLFFVLLFIKTKLKRKPWKRWRKVGSFKKTKKKIVYSVYVCLNVNKIVFDDSHDDDDVSFIHSHCVNDDKKKERNWIASET